MPDEGEPKPQSESRAAFFISERPKMAYFTAVGAKFQFSVTFAAAVAVTSTTNADPAVATTATPHSMTEGDVFAAFFNGWEDANESVYRAGDGTTGSSLVIDGIDSADDVWFPAGVASAGSVRKVTDWIDIGQVLDYSPQGGGVKNISVNPINQRRGINLPAGFEAESVTMTLGFDPKRYDQKAMDKITRNLSQKVAFRFVLSGGATVYAYGTLQKGSMPQLSSSDVAKVSVNLTFFGVPSVHVED